MTGGSLIKRIEENFDSLQKSEKKVAIYLAENSTTRLNGSISALARELGTSVATISRLCRKLKYENFQDLKLSIAEQAKQGSGQFVKNVPEDITLEDDADTVARRLLQSQIVALEKTYDLFDKEVFSTVADAILNAERVVFVGVGGGYAMCVEAVHLFTKIGILCSAHSDAYSQLISSSMSPETTLVFGITFTGTTPSVTNTLAVAAELGANTVAMTSNPVSPAAQSAAHTLLSSVTTSQITPLYGDFLEGRLAQLYILDVLFLMLVIRNFDAANSNLERTSQILRNYYLDGGKGF
jgi:RpiR family carbohydrate utilization transcriptional regulator